MYSLYEKQRALLRLKKNGMAYQRTVVELGYPSAMCLHQWANCMPKPEIKAKARQREHTISKPKPETAAKAYQRKYTLIKPRVSCTIKEKLQAIHRCYDLGESPSKVAKEMGLAAGGVISNWKREYQEKGYLVSTKKDREITPTQSLIEASETPTKIPNDYEALKAAYEALQAQNKAYLEEREKLVAERFDCREFCSSIAKNPVLLIAVNKEALK